MCISFSARFVSGQRRRIFTLQSLTWKMRYRRLLLERNHSRPAIAPSIHMRRTNKTTQRGQNLEKARRIPLQPVQLLNILPRPFLQPREVALMFLYVFVTCRRCPTSSFPTSAHLFSTAVPSSRRSVPIRPRHKCL